MAGQVAAEGALMALFNSAQFADLTIRTPTRHFYAHKAIVGVTSEYFRAACTREFQEASTGVLVLPEEADTVECLLRHLYGLQVPLFEQSLQHGFLTDTKANVISCLKLRIAADKYQLPRLVTLTDAAIVHSLENLPCKLLVEVGIWAYDQDGLVHARDDIEISAQADAIAKINLSAPTMIANVNQAGQVGTNKGNQQTPSYFTVAFTPHQERAADGDQMLHFQSLSAMDILRGMSVEEMRLADYSLNPETLGTGSQRAEGFTQDMASHTDENVPDTSMPNNQIMAAIVYRTAQALCNTGHMENAARTLLFTSPEYAMHVMYALGEAGGISAKYQLHARFLERRTQVLARTRTRQ